MARKLSLFLVSWGSLVLLWAADPIPLPDPPPAGMALAQALRNRRSTRAFAPGGPDLAQAAAVLWAAQGVNRPDGRRTVPSAGATYPLELYLLTEGSKDLPKGAYKYAPRAHRLEFRDSRGIALLRDLRLQRWVKEAPAMVIVAAAEGRTSARYGERAARYVAMEAGACAQSLALQTAALGLGSAVAGAFEDEAVGKALALPPEERPLLIIPFGRPKE